MSFIITTVDDFYTYTALTSDGGAVVDEWEIENDNKKSNTQGFMRKVEKGRTRAKARVSIADSKSNLESVVLKMLTYPANVAVTFPRNIPGKTTNVGEFVMEDYKIVREFNDGNDQEIIIILTEVLG